MLSRVSCVRLCTTLQTAAHQAPLSIGFSRQEYWSGLPFPSPGDLPDPGMETESLTSPALAGGIFTTEPPGKPRRRPVAQHFYHHHTYGGKGTMPH